MRHCARARLAKCATLAMVTLFTLYVVPLAFAQAAPPMARIASIDFPRHAFPGKGIRVTVTVDYSEKFLADIGVWDEKTGDVIQSLTEISKFTGPGKANFQFYMTAPQSDVEWHLVAITRVWWQNAWYQDPNGGSMSFTVSVSNRVTLTIQMVGASSTIKVDGSEYELREKVSVSVPLTQGLHSLAVVQIIPALPGERFVFVGWSDGVNSSQRLLILLGDTIITATYRTEYHLSVESDASNVTGEGWYEKGQEANFAVVPNFSVVTWSGILTDDYRFRGWSGDSTSTSVLSSVVMDGPKAVKAEWAKVGTRVDLGFLANVVLLGTLVLVGRGLYFHFKRESQTGSRNILTMKGSTRSLILLFCLLLTFAIIPHVQAQPTSQPETTIVKIGDAYWYYWNRVTSDTCLLWLGGGISQETIIGYNYYWINPFEYESFGTIHFIQDLTKYYCVLALQKGSYESINPAANRTIHQELYQLQSKIIGEVRQWIRAKAYQHTYLVGYSVGGQAAAMEVALNDPQDWISPDGVVLITVPFMNSVIQHAHQVQANLLFLYGGNLPDFVATGQQFYDNAPSEGWHGSYYYHKEFQVLEDVGHEVWTVRETGAYDTRALNMVVSFIGKSKAVQFSSGTDLGALSPGNVTIISVWAPQKVRPGAIFTIAANLTFNLQTRTDLSIVAYGQNKSDPVSVTSVTLVGNEARTVPLVLVAPPSPSDLSFALYVLQRQEAWLPIAGPVSTLMKVTNLVTLTIQTGLTDIPIVFDGNQYTTAADGAVRIDTKTGMHTVQLQPTVYAAKDERVMFTRWEDSTTSTYREVTLQDDTTLIALFKKQYFVNVTSAYGTAGRSGWFDENSTAAIYVHPPMLENPLVVFAHWTGDLNSQNSRVVLTVDSPKTVTAAWATPGPARVSTGTDHVAWFSIVLFSLAIVLIWNLKLTRSPTSKNRGA